MCFVPYKSVSACCRSGHAIHLVWCRLELIDVRVARKVRVEEIVVQRLPHSTVGAIWHVTVIPVVDVLHGVSLIWGILVPGSIKVGLDKFGQIDPKNWRASLPRQFDAILGTVQSVGWPA